MTRNRIMHLCFGDGYAGSAKMAIINSIYLQKLGYEIKFIASKKSLTSRRTIEANLSTVEIDSNQSYDQILKQVTEEFQKYEPDFLICNHSLDRKLGISLRKKFKKTFTNIAYRHNMSESFPIVGSFIYNFYYDYSIACSAGVGRSLTSSGIFKSKVKVCHYGIEIPKDIDSITGNTIRQKYNLDNKIIIGNSAWFHKKRKGFDLLFECFSKLGEEYVLLIIGIPNDKQTEVFEFASECNISKDRIILPGYVDNIWEYYKAMDIFVFPSRSEGFPIAPLEAAAAKLPIVSSNIQGSNEFIFDGVTGLLFEIAHPEVCVNNIKKLSINSSLRVKLGDEASQLLQQKYTAQKYAERLDQILQGNL